MPTYPDPTHPKFLDGDEMVPPRMESDEDDVQGHLHSLNQPADDEADPDSGASNMRARNQPADDEPDPADGESYHAF